MIEASLRARIRKRFLEAGWLCFTQHGDAYTGPGRSDLMGCADGRFFAVEVKTPTGVISEKQKLFISQVRAAGGIAFVARSVKSAEAGVRLFLERGYMTETAPVEIDDVLDDIFRKATSSSVVAPPTSISEHAPAILERQVELEYDESNLVLTEEAAKPKRRVAKVKPAVVGDEGSKVLAEIRELRGEMVALTEQLSLVLKGILTLLEQER